MDEFCKQLPKLELHAHLSGSLKPHTLQKLGRLKQKRSPSWSLASFNSICSRDDDLASVFNIFKMVQQVTDSCEALFLATTDVIHDFAAENVKYLELRSTPRSVPDSNLTVESYAETILAAMRACEADPSCDVRVKLLLSIDRRQSVEASVNTIKLASRLKQDEATSNLIGGLDFSGDPMLNDARQFLPVFDLAKREGLKLAVHLAEAPGKNDEILPILLSDVDRLGHATFLHPEVGGEQRFVDVVRERNLPIELCLTSNLKCKTVASVDVHHLKYWLDLNHPVAICTDDCGVFHTNLATENSIAASAFALSAEKLYELSFNSVDFSFASDAEKTDLRNEFERFRKTSLCERRSMGPS